MSEDTAEIVTSITRKAVLRRTRIIVSFLAGCLATLVLTLSSYHAIHQWSQEVSEISVKEDTVKNLSREIDDLLTGIDGLLERYNSQLTEVADLREKLLKATSLRVASTENVVYYDQIFPQ